MSFEGNLINFAKKVKAGIEDAGEDALKLANWLAANQTEISGLASLAGANGTKVANTATNVLSAVSTAVQAAGDAATTNGLTVTLDAAVIADVKDVIGIIEKV
jgi:hypothetical protein